MEFQFNCPNCNYVITEKDFKENDKILSSLKEIFNQHESSYAQQIKNKLQAHWDVEHQQKITAELSKQELKLNEIKAQEINKIKGELNQYQHLLVKEQSKQEKLLVQQEMNLTIKKQQEIAELNSQILNLQNLIKNHQNTTDKTIAEKINLIEKLKYEELQKLNDIINQQKIELNTNQLKLDKMLLEQAQAINDKKQQEIEVLKQQINELKEANIQFKVIQNKTKGETFEHDVEAELRKVFEPEDVITKITAQDKKADYLHEIRKDNNVIGKIVYEVKNAEWSNAWEKKLIEDMGKQKSKYGILVATSFNKKYPSIPFKRSDYNPNIYLSDAESFYFVAQILKTLINVEYNLASKYSHKEYEEKFKKFNEWKISELPRFTEILHSNCKKIEETETTIIKKIDSIRIAREKILNNWIKNIKVFLENINF